MILTELIGRVLVYSNPLPSAVNRARGRNSAKIPPMEVAESTTAVLSISRLEAITTIIIVSRTGRAKKKAVAGFLEATFRSFHT